ncbi:cell division protein FtsZ [Eubacteriales bacterium OttesenSCG-928-G02]|nr:cell division protein FtsZ [Eubacteriales bacterium OttesenSCG-928-G02]
MTDLFNMSGVSIKVIGIGGGGNNAVDRMIVDNLKDVEYININTDAKTLNASKAKNKINIGERITNGQGTGMNVELGKRCAEDATPRIAEAIKGANMVFLTAGMGGGTGTGAISHIAKIAKESGALTVAIVTKPFNFEGKNKIRQADEGIEMLSQYVDSLIVIPNERLKLLTNKKITLLNAFIEADEILRKGVQSISELITTEGYINLDFADISAVMTNAGLAHMGVGSAKGKDKAEQAAKMAMSSPILETNINGARGIIVNITSSPDIGLEEIEQAASIITDEANPEAKIMFGTVFDSSLEDEMRITLIATGFDRGNNVRKNTKYEQESEKTPETPKSTDDDINNIIEMLNKSRNV